MTHVHPEEPVTIPVVRAAAGRGGAKIVALDCYDVRFPTSLEHDGSDAMNPDPDYSAAYAVLRTDDPGLEGHALCFTIGRGSDVMVTAVAAPVTGATYDYHVASDELIGRAGSLARQCARFGVPLRAAAARFPLTHPAVASVLIGARSAAEISDALRLRALDIPAALWDSLATADEKGRP